MRHQISSGINLRHTRQTRLWVPPLTVPSYLAVLPCPASHLPPEEQIHMLKGPSAPSYPLTPLTPLCPLCPSLTAGEWPWPWRCPWLVAQAGGSRGEKDMIMDHKQQHNSHTTHTWKTVHTLPPEPPHNYTHYPVSNVLLTPPDDCCVTQTHPNNAIAIAPRDVRQGKAGYCFLIPSWLSVGCQSSVLRPGSAVPLPSIPGFSGCAGLWCRSPAVCFRRRTQGKVLFGLPVVMAGVVLCSVCSLHISQGSSLSHSNTHIITDWPLIKAGCGDALKVI